MISLEFTMLRAQRPAVRRGARWTDRAWPRSEFGFPVVVPKILGDRPPPDQAPPSDRDESESERERLVAVWRLHPAALVDLMAEEVTDGGNDGAGVLRMTDEDGNAIDEFLFATTHEADDALLYALRQLNPGG